MRAEHYRALFEYNAWATDRVLDRVAELSESEYTAPAALDHGNGSILATLVHALGAEEAWIERCQGRDLADALSAEQVPQLRFADTLG